MSDVNVETANRPTGFLIKYITPIQKEPIANIYIHIHRELANFTPI